MFNSTDLNGLELLCLFTCINYFLEMLKCRPLFLKVWSSNWSTGNTWELAVNVESQTPLETYCTGIYSLTNPQVI